MALMSSLMTALMALAFRPKRPEERNAFARYLPTSPLSNRHTATNEGNQGESEDFEPPQISNLLRIENAGNSNENGFCGGVADENGGEAPFADQLENMRLSAEIALLREDLEAERGRSTRYRVECESWRAWGLNHAQQQQAWACAQLAGQETMWAEAQNAMQGQGCCNCVPARHDLLLRGQ